ncbi:hypothetical protein BH11BAC3_BH11BAC3_25850 [soil metagenome]
MPASITNKSKMLTPTKAIAVRKKISTLNEQSASSFLSVTTAKKEFEQLKKNMQKDLDSLSEMGEMESLRLQMAMDRMSKMMSTLSNLLKKISDTANTITQNLK